MMDGANGWQRFWRITLPQLRPTLFTVLTLGPDRLLAGLRPDLHRHAGRPSQDDPDSGLPLVPGGFHEPAVGTGRGDRVHPVRHHHRLHAVPALGAARAPGVEAADAALPGHATHGEQIMSRASQKRGDRQRRRERSRHLAGGRRPPAPPGRTSGRRMSAGRSAANSVFYAVLVVIAIVYIFPFLIQISTSFKTDAEATATRCRSSRTTWTTAAYQTLFRNSDFPTWFKNSVDRHRLRHARPGVLRLARRLRARRGCTSAAAT